MTRAFSALALLLTSAVLSGQNAGQGIYTFLQLPAAGNISAMGGIATAIQGPQVANTLSNPAQTDPGLDAQISIQHMFMPAGIQSGFAGYAKRLRQEAITLHGSVKYQLYGKFDFTDEFGNTLGEFTGSEMAIHGGLGYQLYDKMTLGANVKFIQSALESYRSFGMALDLGLVYSDTAQLWSVAFVVKDLGAQITPYELRRERLRADVQIGVRKQLRYLPFTIYLSYHNLNRWNLLYDDPNSEENLFIGGGPDGGQQSGLVDNFFRHLVFGGEFRLGRQDVMRLRLGYNHQRKQELTVPNFRTLTGFSLGFGFHVKRLRFDYAVNQWHFGGSTHHLGITSSLKQLSGPGIL